MDAAPVVIGAGIAGVACATALRDRGIAPTVLDRGRVPGGRMASRTLRGSGTPYDGRVTDIGASYFTARDPRFREIVSRLEHDGTVRAWTDTFHVADGSGITGVRTGPMRYAAPRGLRSVVETLAAGLAIEHGREVREACCEQGSLLVDGEPARALALCLPQPQAARFAGPGLLPDAEPPTWEPVIAVTAVFEERCWPELDGVFVNDDPVLTWIADDGARRGDGAPVLVAHVHPVLAAGHLEDPAGVLPAAVATLHRVLRTSAQPVWVEAMRWTFARPLSADDAPCWLVSDLPAGAAGDAWHGGPRIEAAWLSGSALGSALADRLG